MAKRRNPLLTWTLTSVTLSFVALVSLMPLRLARFLGKYAGRAAYFIVPRIRRVGWENIDRAYGDTLPQAEKRRILMGACENIGIVAAEFPRAPMLLKPGADALFRIKGLEHIDRTRGGLLAGAHLGNWEWMVAGVSAAGLPVTIVVRPLDDPRLNAMITRVRRACGAQVIDKEAAGPEIIRAIRDGMYVGMLIDQSARDNGVPATFFGASCWATVAPAMVAIRAKAPIYPTITARDPDGMYTLEFLPPIEIERTGDLRADLVNVTQQCQDVIEQQVRAHPDQWLWMHRRWKERPRLQREWEEREARDRKRHRDPHHAV